MNTNNKITLFCLIIICFIYFSISGYASDEESIIKNLEADPDNPELNREAAEFYYNGKEYKKAISRYKKLKRLNSIKETETYYMYICHTRTRRNSGKYWKKIDELKNLNAIKYKTHLHIENKKKLSLNTPEHWLLSIDENQTGREILSANNISKDHSEYLINLIPEIGSRMVDLNKDTGNIKFIKIKKSNKKGSTQPVVQTKYFDVKDFKIYCRPGFIINYQIKYPMKQTKKELKHRFIKRTLFNSFEEYFLKIVEGINSEAEAGEIKDVTAYYYTPKKKRGNTISWKKIDYFKTRRLPRTSHRCTMGMISFLKTYKKTTKSNFNLFVINKIKYVVIFLRSPDGFAAANFTTCFNDKYSKIYMEEIERLISSTSLW